MVDLRGVEPRHHECKSSVLPLSLEARKVEVTGGIEPPNSRFASCGLGHLAISPRKWWVHRESNPLQEIKSLLLIHYSSGPVFAAPTVCRSLPRKEQLTHTLERLKADSALDFVRLFEIVMRGLSRASFNYRHLFHEI